MTYFVRVIAAWEARWGQRDAAEVEVEIALFIFQITLAGNFGNDRGKKIRC